MNLNSTGDGLMLQFPLDKIGHHRIQMPGSISAINSMVSVGIVERFKLFIRSNQGIDKVYGVLVMDIIIPGTVNQQEIAFEFVYMRNRTVVVIAPCIQLRCLQIPFG